MWVNRNMIAGILNTKGYRKAEEDAMNTAFYWLEVVDLVDCANRLAGELSYGQQRRLEIARAMCTRPQPILELKEIDVYYGPIQALKKVSMHIDEGETVSLIGSNGAGKSTLLMSIFVAGRSSCVPRHVGGRKPDDGHDPDWG
uniref:Probable transport protein, chloroplastic n=1 Tax=Tanacetum cinerariifolium TaxID=118510 RepID=A0A699S8J7_TANCI|nr:probable transport protein, chloroplastic [Tanacetum cinerariifolium]